MTSGKSTTPKATNRQRRSSGKRLNIDVNAEAVGIVSQLAGVATEPANTISLNQISLSSSQPRRYFDPDKHKQLVESVKRDGILQPMLVRPIEGERFELVAGERRYRAAAAVGLEEVPVLIREMTPEQARQYALVENLQREDLNPVEETEGLLQLLSVRLGVNREEVISLLNRMSNRKRGLTDNVIRGEDEQAINEVFAAVGRFTAESFRVNRLPLLNLPQNVLLSLKEGKLEYTKGKVIAQVKDEAERQKLLEKAVEQGLSLSQIRERVKALKPVEDPKKLPGAEEVRKRVGSLNRLSKKSAALDDPTTREQVDKLLAKLEKLLSSD